MASLTEQIVRKMNKDDKPPIDFETFRQLCLELDFKPPCDCPECRLQYRYNSSDNPAQFAYGGNIELEEAAGRIQATFYSIIGHIAHLRRATALHGNLILQRWCRGSKQRRKILETVKPVIYRTQNPLLEIVANLEIVEGSLAKQRKHKSAYMMPYVNIDNLVEDPHRLIGLLHYRTHNFISSWVPFDNSVIQLGWEQGAFFEKSVEGCVMMHHTNLAILIEFDPNAVHRGEAYTTPRALLILEMQLRLMVFLRKVVAVLLEGVDTSPLSDKIHGPLTQCLVSEIPPCQNWIEFLKDREPHHDQPWQTFGAISTERPFSNAPECDVDILLEIAEARASEAQDELWLLQTDLEYFYEHAKYHEARWFDKVPSVDALNHSTAKEKHDNIGFVMTIKALIHARDWQWILEECQRVKIEQMKHEAEIIEAQLTLGRALPPSYEDALGSLQQLLQESWNYHKLALGRDLMRFPGSQEIFKQTGVQDSVFGKLLIYELRGNLSKLFSDDRITWCLYELVRPDMDPVYRYDPAIVLQHLDECMRTCSNKETRRVGQEIARSISDLAAVSQMLSILNLHRPRFRKPTVDDLQARSPAWQVHVPFIKDPMHTRMYRMDLGSAFSPVKKFQMPQGRKDDKWLRHWDTAHQALDSMWKKAREAYQMMLDDKMVPQEFIDPQLDMMKQCESTENIGHLAMERQEILGRMQAARQRAVAARIVPTITDRETFVGQQDEQAKYHSEAPEEKVKTRPLMASIQPDDNSAIELAPEIPQIQQVLYKFGANSTAAKVVRLLYPDSADSKLKEGKCIEWLDFIRTMKELGFSAEHGGGSAFSFKGKINHSNSMSGQQNRSIVVHRPHPDTEMGPGMLRGLAKRLYRRFGWERKNFLIS